MKSSQTKQKLVSIGQTGVADIPLILVRTIGALEILGAIGLILPWLLNIASILTSIAAICFAIIMILAAKIHYKRHEPKCVMQNIIILLVCIFVAYGRLMQF